MNDTSNLSENRLTTLMVSVLQEKWRQEIEKAVDRVKMKTLGKRSRRDRWLRHLWYREEALGRRLLHSQSRQATSKPSRTK